MTWGFAFNVFIGSGMVWFGSGVVRRLIRWHRRRQPGYRIEDELGPIRNRQTRDDIVLGKHNDRYR